jgi:hypothetical protein
MRTILAMILGVVALAALLHGCGQAGSPAEGQDEQEGVEQAEPTPEPTTPTGASGGVSSEEQAAQSEAECRLETYVAQENMSRQEANAFSELLADMIRTMEDPSWTAGSLRNAALDHLGVPRYPECKLREE